MFNFIFTLCNVYFVISFFTIIYLVISLPSYAHYLYISKLPISSFFIGESALYGVFKPFCCIPRHVSFLPNVWTNKMHYKRNIQRPTHCHNSNKMNKILLLFFSRIIFLLWYFYSLPQVRRNLRVNITRLPGKTTRIWAESIGSLSFRRIIGSG